MKNKNSWLMRFAREKGFYVPAFKHHVTMIGKTRNGKCHGVLLSLRRETFFTIES